ncbi:MAG TPA: hydrolase TatD, partial [Asanoa sp.]|nr:hydrolase TatD [Asanoa sp.]
MRIFDPHIHMTSRTTDDYERMAAAGVRALVEPAFWLGQPRTSVDSFTDYFDSLVGWEPFRAGQFGIRHHATIAL